MGADEREYCKCGKFPLQREMHRCLTCGARVCSQCLNLEGLCKDCRPSVFDKMLSARSDPDHGFNVGAFLRLKERVNFGDKIARDFMRNVFICKAQNILYWENPYKSGTDDYDSWENQKKSGYDWIEQELSQFI